MMGLHVDNFEGGKHVSGGTLQGFFLRLHRGDQGIDSRSPDMPAATWAYLISVAQSGNLADLDAAGAAALPGWWPANVHAREGGVAAVRMLLTG